ncbi:MAG: prepilin-type N-terminal cleavage/methylation domain-containing protein [Candidatus Omnitrophica bacterium]|nr:prepilin-type N-terminal cleavage/methylation domain-containing protein [Candidatus Omnitrophota bacterium]MBU0881059.1 prepilin-type N-terminal cleavage/methylation domain-containing protein [Candidatus Omnitrophota bacterium]MBU0895336.1 prepilin-type N-terminal cleavage/methylation domain-containing protein [Candidatus Omnitrophota bacterium]MBU1807975.1 prepilin-type N-terminal cleavage/methylation domain-containing protein [Candidatus Omnitrophota bacterium]
MSLITVRSTLNSRKGFTLAEVLVATIIGTMVMASAWSVYVMVWQWWAETSPRIEVERTARLALLNIIDGVTSVGGLSGDVAGSYTIGSTSYKRRNGIAWANKDPGDSSYPQIQDQTGMPASRILYHLEPDAGNTKREFYYGTDNGQGAVYYKHTNGVSYMLNGTRGITNLKFEKFVDPEGYSYDNIIKVTVTAQKEVYGTRAQQSYTVGVVYTDTVYLRNAL